LINWDCGQLFDAVNDIDHAENALTDQYWGSTKVF
jgi:hypothetical protein